MGEDKTDQPQDEISIPTAQKDEKLFTRTRAGLLVWASVFIILAGVCVFLVLEKPLNQLLVSSNPDLASTLWVAFFTGWPMFSLIGSTIAIKYISGLLRNTIGKNLLLGVIAWVVALGGILLACAGILTFIPNMLNMAISGLPV